MLWLLWPLTGGMMIMSDTLSFDTILRIAEFLAIVGGGGLVLIRLGATTQRLESTLSSQGREIGELKKALTEVSRVLVDVALQKQRLDTHDKRLDEHAARLSELAHGEGFIFPLSESIRSLAKPSRREP